MTVRRLDALLDGYVLWRVFRDRADAPPTMADAIPDDCVLVYAVSRAQHPVFGPVEVGVPVPTELFDDPDFDVVMTMRPMLDGAVKATLDQARFGG